MVGGKLHELKADLTRRKDSRPATDITHVLVQAAGIDLDNHIEGRFGCTTQGEILTQYGDLITQIKEVYPNATPLVASVPPRVCNSNHYLQLTRKFNQQLRQVAEEKGAMYVAPAPVEFRNPLSMWPNARMYHDGHHFSDRGNEAYTQNLVKYIANFASRPAQNLQ